MPSVNVDSNLNINYCIMARECIGLTQILKTQLFA